MSTAPTSAGTGEQQGAPPSPEAIMQLGGGYWASKTLLSAVELGVFTELASSGPQDAETLRGRLGLHQRSALDFFDALVALQMLDRVIRYLEQAEPGNPAPLLIERAKKLIGVSFLEIMANLAPNAMDTIENVTGKRPSE